MPTEATDYTDPAQAPLAGAAKMAGNAVRVKELPAILAGADLVALHNMGGVHAEQIGISERTWRRWRHIPRLATWQANAVLGAWTRTHPGDDLAAFLEWAEQPDRKDLECPCTWRREGARHAFAQWDRR